MSVLDRTRFIFKKLTGALTLPMMLVAARAFSDESGASAGGLLVTSHLLKQFAIQLLETKHIRDTALEANRLHQDETADASERRRLLNMDFARAVAKTVQTLALAELGDHGRREPWKTVIAKFEESWINATRDADESFLGPVADSRLLDAIVHDPQQPAFPATGDRELWRELLNAVVRDAGVDEAAASSAGEIERVAHACDVRFYSEFYNTLKTDFSTDGRAFAGVVLRSSGETLLRLRRLEKTGERTRQQLDRVVELLHDAATRTINLQSSIGAVVYQAFGPYIEEITASLADICGAQRRHSWYLRGISAGVLLALTGILVVLWLITQNPRSASTSSFLDPLLTALRERTRAGPMMLPSGGRPLTAELQRRVEEAQSKGTPTYKALCLLALVDEAQAGDLLQAVDRRIAAIDSDPRPRASPEQVDYDLLRGYRASLVGDFPTARQFLDRAYEGAPDNTTVVLLLCATLLDSRDTDGSTQTERAVEILRTRLEARDLKPAEVLALRIKLASALYLVGQFNSAVESVLVLGIPRQLAARVAPVEAAAMLALLGQLQLAMGNHLEAIETLELAHAAAASSLLPSHPDYAAIRVIQAHAFVAAGKPSSAAEAIADLQPLLDSLNSAGAITPFALTAAADVFAGQAEALASSANPRGDPDLWRKATRYQRDGCGLLKAHFGSQDIRTIEASAQLSAILFKQGYLAESRAELATLLDAIRAGVAHPRMVPLCLVASATLTVPMAAFADDGSQSSGDSTVQDALLLANAAYENAHRLEEAFKRSAVVSKRDQRRAEEQVSDALSQLTAVHLLTGAAHEALDRAKAMQELRTRLYNEDDPKLYAGLALLGRAQCISGDAEGAQKSLEAAYDGLRAFNKPYLTPWMWAACRALCKQHQSRGDEAAQLWCDRANTLRAGS